MWIQNLDFQVGGFPINGILFAQILKKYFYPDSESKKLITGK